MLYLLHTMLPPYIFLLIHGIISSALGFSKYNNKWVDHGTFGLSMQVYGSVSAHVINIMSEAVMVDQYKRAELGLLPEDSWSRHIVHVDTAICLIFSALLCCKIYVFFLPYRIIFCLYSFVIFYYI